jgi:hypothetical protein
LLNNIEANSPASTSRKSSEDILVDICTDITDRVGRLLGKHIDSK